MTAWGRGPIVRAFKESRAVSRPLPCPASPEYRPGRAGPWECALWFLAAAVPTLAMSVMHFPGALHGDLVNPDSAMRLVRLEAILAAGMPLHHVARDGSGSGTLLHWSHLLDSLLLALAAPGAAAIGWHEALRGTAMAFGPLCMGLLGMTAAWAVAPVARHGLLWFGALAISLSPFIVGYGCAGVVHHHIPVAIVVCMTAGWALRAIRGDGDRSGGLALGAWIGAGVWLSPESLPLSLMALGAVWLAWVLEPGCGRLGRVLAQSGASFAGVVALAWLVDPPFAGMWVSEPDRLSLMFVLLALGAAACGMAASLAGRALPAGAARALVLGLAAGAGVSWVAAFPAVLGGATGLLQPEQAQAFFGGITEMQPVRSVAEATDCLLAGALMTGLVLAIGVRRRAPVLLYAGLCGVAVVWSGSQHVRFSTYAALWGAALLPAATSWLMTVLSESRETVRVLARTAAIAVVLLTPRVTSLVTPAQAATASGPACRLGDAAALLAGHDGAVVLSNVNDVPELLWRTGVLTVGSLYHRGMPGFMRLRAAWRSVPGETVSPEVEATRAGWVLLCPGPARSLLLGDAPRTTLLDRLNAHEPPDWLRLAGTSGGYALYEVVR